MSLRSKLLIGITAVILFMATSIGYTSISFVERLVFDNTLSTMERAALTATNEIENWFKVRQTLLKMIVTGLETDEYSSDDPQLLYAFQTISERFHNYFKYLYMGFDDKTFVTTRKEYVSPDFDPTTRPWFKSAAQNTGVIITAPYPNRATGNFVSSMALRFAGTTPGVLGIDLDISDLAYLSNNAVFRPEAEVVLISPGDKVLYSTNATIASTGQPWEKAEYMPLNPYIVSSKNDPVYIPQIERNGKSFAVFLSTVPSAQWSVATAIPVDLLYIEQKKLLQRIVGVSLIALMISLSLAYWIITKLTHPLAALASTAQKLEDGDMNVRFEASESYEATHLADCLEKMKSTLIGAIVEKDALLHEAEAKNEEKLFLLAQMKKLNQDLSSAYQETQELYVQTIQALSDSIEAKDPYTHGHSSRVLLYSELVGTSLGWDNKTMNNLRYAAILHDIGKIGIPEGILNKPASLTPKEYEAVKLHPVLGSKILQNIPHLQAASKAVLQHHEHFDGNGYPYGLSGEDISPIARVLAVSDAYDAMTSARPYRPAVTPEEAFAELQQFANKQFDPKIVAIFCKALPDLEKFSVQTEQV